MSFLVQEPLVAVVTPVFDGAAYLARCIDSVLAQRYEHWIHLIVDNASRDGTLEVAQAAADWDERIRVIAHRDHVSMLDNWNRALAAVPPAAVYVKQLHADDELHPDCLPRMVAGAERHPGAAIVTGLRTASGALRPAGAPHAMTLVPGRSVARAALFGGVNWLGTPSLPLLRREQVVGWPALFDGTGFPAGHAGAMPLPHADKQAFLATLEQSDLVFVPHVLLEQRRSHASATGTSQRVGAWHPSRIEFLLRHGTRFADRSTVDRALRRAALRWAGSLARRIAARNALCDPRYAQFQMLCLDQLLPRLRERGQRGVAALLGAFTPPLRRAARSAPVPAPAGSGAIAGILVSASDGRSDPASARPRWLSHGRPRHREGVAARR